MLLKLRVVKESAPQSKSIGPASGTALKTALERPVDNPELVVIIRFQERRSVSLAVFTRIARDGVPAPRRTRAATENARKNKKTGPMLVTVHMSVLERLVGSPVRVVGRHLLHLLHPAHRRRAVPAPSALLVVFTRIARDGGRGPRPSPVAEVDVHVRRKIGPASATARMNVSGHSAGNRDLARSI